MQEFAVECPPRALRAYKLMLSAMLTADLVSTTAATPFSGLVPYLAGCRRVVQRVGSVRSRHVSEQARRLFEITAETSNFLLIDETLPMRRDQNCSYPRALAGTCACLRLAGLGTARGLGCSDLWGVPVWA